MHQLFKQIIYYTEHNDVNIQLKLSSVVIQFIVKLLFILLKRYKDWDIN